MILLSIDGSTKSTGWALFEDKKLISSGRIKAKDDEKDFRMRVKYMMKRLDEVIRAYHPDKVVMEDVPLKKGTTKTSIMLGVLQGCILGLCATHDIFIDFIPVSTWRSDLGLFDGTVEGKTRDSMKKKSIEFANEKFGLCLKYVSPSSTKNEDDEADAICIGWSVIGDKQNKKTLGKKAKIK